MCLSGGCIPAYTGQGVSAWAGLPQCMLGYIPPVDRILDTLVKTLPFRNYVADSNKNAFKWDAYCPLQLPSGGVSAQGVYTPPVNRMTEGQV